MKKSIPVHPRKWMHIFVIKHRRVSSRLNPAHYPHLTTTTPTENCRNRSHPIRMPRAVHVYKKTRSLTHDLKPPKHPQMQMKQQLKTAYRVSNQVAKEQRPHPEGRGGGDDRCPKQIVNYQRGEFPDTFQRRGSTITSLWVRSPEDFGLRTNSVIRRNRFRHGKTTQRFR